MANTVNSALEANGEVFKDNATHLKMFGGREIDILPSEKGALLQVREPFSLIRMNQQEYNKFLSLENNQQRKSFVEDYLKQHSPGVYRQLKQSQIDDERMRRIGNTPWDADGNDHQFSGLKFKHYPPEELNPRISHVRGYVEPNQINLMMIVDGKERWATISNRNTVDAYHRGLIDDTQLANRVLPLIDQQAKKESHMSVMFDMYQDYNEQAHGQLHR